MAAQNKKSKKGDIKTVIIIILGLVVGFQALMLWNRGKATTSEEVKNVPAAHEEEEVQPAKPAAHQPVAVNAPPLGARFPSGNGSKIAFILDDWGYTMHNCKYLHAIAAPLTISIMPSLRHTNDIAECAEQSGKDTMLHLPLEPYHNPDKYPDNYLITTTMKPALVVKIVEDTLAKMPYVKGVNNHMGSKATEDKDLMRLIFKQIKRHKLFFVDSMTSPHHSICGELASAMDLPFARRDVFLDNINTKTEIEKQIEVLARKARLKGYAIAIGHDRELTLKVLQEEIPQLQRQGFQIVRVKDLVHSK